MRLNGPRSHLGIVKWIFCYLFRTEIFPVSVWPQLALLGSRKEERGRNMAFNLCKLAKHYAMAAATVGFIFSGIWDGIGIGL